MTVALSTSPAEPSANALLRDALLESRGRWRDLVGMAADLAFETDAAGRFVFVSPDPAIGWPAANLIGQPAELLLVDADDATGFNPFRPAGAVRRRRAWLRHGDGGNVCLSFAAMPLLDPAGHPAGARGVGQDTTEQDNQDSSVASALRRAELLDHMLWRMRQEVLAPRMMQAALEALVIALGAEGCAVLDLVGDGVQANVLHQVGAGLAEVRASVTALLEAGPQEITRTAVPDGRPLLVCPSHGQFGARAGLALWRQPAGRDWDDDELMLAESATGIIRVILSHDAVQREMARQARTDPLTGLLNRRAFLDEMERRVERLERDGLPGTLMFVDLDNFKDLNDRSGHDAGDEALCITAALLRATLRPADLVSRFGGDEFALWLDGADELAAAERAESLRVEGPKSLAHLGVGHDLALTMSIGIATRWPARGEAIEITIHRADQAMYQVKRAGRGHWHVARPRTIP